MLLLSQTNSFYPPLLHCLTDYHPFAPATAGAFLFLQSQLDHPKCNPKPGTLATNTARKQFPWHSMDQYKTLKRIKPSIIINLPLIPLFPQPQPPNTSLSIAITDAIGSPKSHRNLLPLLWERIGSGIKAIKSWSSVMHSWRQVPALEQRPTKTKRLPVLLAAFIGVRKLSLLSP